jgi:hypothetical protein
MLALPLAVLSKLLCLQLAAAGASMRVSGSIFLCCAWLQEECVACALYALEQSRDVLLQH